MKAAANAKDDLEQLTPHSQDQRAKLRKLMADIAAVEKRVENSVKVIEVESKEFERLEQKH